MKKNIICICMATVAAFLFSCSKDKDEVKSFTLEESYTMMAGDTDMIPFELKGYDESDIEWDSEDEFVATTTSNGRIKALHVGTTNISAELPDGGGSGICELTVEGQYNLYGEVFLTFGASPAKVKGWEKRELISDDGEVVFYEDPSRNVEYIGYLFENRKLTGCGVTLSSSVSDGDVDEFLSERYEYDEEDDTFVYYTKGSLMVARTLYEENVMVMYMENTGLRSAAGSSTRFSALAEKLRESKSK